MGLKLTGNAVDFQSWSVGESQGIAEFYDEEKGSKLTGVCKNRAESGDKILCTLNIWSGPAYQIPHMMLSFGSQDGEYLLTADYVSRGPVPIGTDQNMIDKFYNKDVISWYDNIMNSDNIKPLKPSTSFGGRLLRSPIAVAACGLTLDTLTTAATSHVDRWLEWSDKEQQNEARQRGAMNARDDKLRVFAYGASISEVAPFGGNAELAAAWTGPIAEAYIGGGS